MLKENWFALYTAPRAEKKAGERLTLNGFKVFVPTMKEKKKWSDRVKIVEMPLFSSYIFIFCDEYHLRLALGYKGIVTYVRYLGEPAIVKEEEIQAIKDFITLAEENKIINEGDLVSIISGPLEKVSGKVTQIDKKYAYLFIESIGITVCVEKINIDK